MFGGVFVSDGQNESPLIMALIFIAQLALLSCGKISVCYTCDMYMIMKNEKHRNINIFRGQFLSREHTSNFSADLSCRPTPGQKIIYGGGRIFVGMSTD